MQAGKQVHKGLPACVSADCRVMVVAGVVGQHRRPRCRRVVAAVVSMPARVGSFSFWKSDSVSKIAEYKVGGRFVDLQTTEATETDGKQTANSKQQQTEYLVLVRFRSGGVCVLVFLLPLYSVSCRARRRGGFRQLWRCGLKQD